MFITEQRFDRYGRRDPAENLMVPFQHYSFNSFVFAIDPNTNLSIPIKIFGIRDTLGDFVIRSRDAAATSELTYDSGNGLITTQVESRVLRVEITQSAIAKAFAISLFLVNWMLTAGSVYATALVAFRMLDANNVVAALPFSAPFSIPILRSLYVNSPPSGTSVGQCPIVSVALFHILTNCLRGGWVFRADGDRRVVFSDHVRSPRESWIIVII